MSLKSLNHNMEKNLNIKIKLFSTFHFFFYPISLDIFMISMHHLLSALLFYILNSSTSINFYFLYLILSPDVIHLPISISFLHELLKKFNFMEAFVCMSWDLDLRDDKRRGFLAFIFMQLKLGEMLQNFWTNILIVRIHYNF